MEQRNGVLLREVSAFRMCPRPLIEASMNITNIHQVDSC